MGSEYTMKAVSAGEDNGEAVIRTIVVLGTSSFDYPADLSPFLPL